MTKGQIAAEIVKSHFGIPRKEILAMIIEKAGCTTSSASAFYYYFVKDLGLVAPKSPKAPKEKPVKIAKSKAPKKPRIKKIAILTTEKARPFQKSAEAFLKWRDRMETEVDEDREVEELEFFDFDRSPSEEAREILRVIAD
jgi:hypothetical protein